MSAFGGGVGVGAVVVVDDVGRRVWRAAGVVGQPGEGEGGKTCLCNFVGAEKFATLE